MPRHCCRQARRLRCLGLVWSPSLLERQTAPDSIATMCVLNPASTALRPAGLQGRFPERLCSSLHLHRIIETLHDFILKLDEASLALPPVDRTCGNGPGGGD